ncbi:hypothetical protein BDV19DRAFT_368023 [Aspergillus venezuelensis]
MHLLATSPSFLHLSVPKCIGNCDFSRLLLFLFSVPWFQRYICLTGRLYSDIEAVRRRLILLRSPPYLTTFSPNLRVRLPRRAILS